MSSDYRYLIHGATGETYFLIGDASPARHRGGAADHRISARCCGRSSRGLPLSQLMGGPAACSLALRPASTTLVCIRASSSGDIEIYNAGHPRPLSSARAGPKSPDGKVSGAARCDRAADRGMFSSEFRRERAPLDHGRRAAALRTACSKPEFTWRGIRHRRLCVLSASMVACVGARKAFVAAASAISNRSAGRGHRRRCDRYGRPCVVSAGRGKRKDVMSRILWVCVLLVVSLRINAHSSRVTGGGPACRCQDLVNRYAEFGDSTCAPRYQETDHRTPPGNRRAGDQARVLCTVDSPSVGLPEASSWPLQWLWESAESEIAATSSIAAQARLGTPTVGTTLRRRAASLRCGLKRRSC